MATDHEQLDQQAYEVPPLNDDEWLLRLHFSPEHIADGALVPGAISTSDLSSRGVSLDREKMVELAVIENRAITQSQRSPEQRHQPYISRFQCESVRLIRDENGELAFIVKESPTPDNIAHAEILSAQKNLKPAALKKLRNQLLPELQKNLMPLEEYLDALPIQDVIKRPKVEELTIFLLYWIRRIWLDSLRFLGRR